MQSQIYGAEDTRIGSPSHHHKPDLESSFTCHDPILPHVVRSSIMTMLGTTDIRANRNLGVIGKRSTDLVATAGNGQYDGGEATSRIGFFAMAVKTWSCEHMAGGG